MRTALLLPLLLLAPEGGVDTQGPPAFLPHASEAAGAALRSARALAEAGRVEEAVQAYQGVVDGPLADRLAPADRVAEEFDTFEQARERAVREMSLVPDLVAAAERRYGETAREVVDRAAAAGDSRLLRDAFARYPLTRAGSRAGLLLAREAHRRGDPGEALGILDRLLLLDRTGDGAGIPPGDFLALRGAAAAAEGDGELFAEVEREATALGPEVRTAAGGGIPLAAFLRERREGAGFGRRRGPGGPLVLRWEWMPRPRDLPPPEDPYALRPLNRAGLPAPPDHGVAVRDGVVYWCDRYRVTALSLEDGSFLHQSTPVYSGPDGRELPGGATEHHRGEFFAPAVAGSRLVAALDSPSASPRGSRVGALHLFDLDADLRLERTRGGAAEMDYPDLAQRFVFHGRPLVLGNRLFVAVSEASRPGEPSAGGVRTHVLGFRLPDLVPLFDTVLCFGIGVQIAEVAPAGSVAARHGRLYLSSNTGVEACLDARTGGILWACLYPRPAPATAGRLSSRPDGTEIPVLWYHAPPAFSGRFVAFAPRDSAYLDFLHQLPDRATGGIRETARPRKRRDGIAINAFWVVPGPAETFFVAGQSRAPEEPPLHQVDADPAALDPIRLRGPLEEDTVLGLPAFAGEWVYAITAKALYRLPVRGADGAIERFPLGLSERGVHPEPGNLVVLEDRVLSVSDTGILCFGPPEEAR